MLVDVEDEEDADDAIWISEFMVRNDPCDLESPIDLNIAKMTVKKLKPLIWCNYQTPPKKLKLTNTGRTVAMGAKWHQESPFLTCGPFLSRYIFSQFHFHWGLDDMEGSEHSVDGASSPMELHAVHFKSTYLNQEAAIRKPDGISIIVYFFKSLENPNMNGIVKTLPLIQQANSSMRIIPWVLTNLIRPFGNDYFFYRGSISSGNIVHSVLWLISRQPIGISVEQVAEFRNLKDKNFERLGRNSCVRRETGNRSVYHVNPSGSMYASLLPIPRDDPPSNAMDTVDCCGTVANEEISKTGKDSSGV